MEHNVQENGGTLVIAFSGDIDLQSSPDARKALLALVGKGAPILVDLSGVGYIDWSRSAKGRCVFCNWRAWTESLKFAQPWTRALLRSVDDTDVQ